MVVGEVRKDKKKWVRALPGESKKACEKRALKEKARLMRVLEEEARRAGMAKVDFDVKFGRFVKEVYLPRIGSASNRGGANANSTYRTKKDIITTHLLPYFAKKRVRDIDQREVEAFVQYQERATYTRGGKSKKYSNTSISSRVRVLRHILNTAVELKVLKAEELPRMPASDMTPKRRKAFKGQLASEEAYTPKEVKKLLTAAKADGPMWYGLLVFLMRAGPRVGEAIALQWDDIDFDGGVLHIRRQAYANEVKAPKTGAREVSLHPVVAKALRGVPKRGKWVFGGLTNPDKPLASSIVRKRGNAWAEAAGVEKGFRPHACRHTCASTFLAAGISTTVVARWMGHSERMLVQVYAHLLREDSHRLMLGVDFGNDEVELEVVVGEGAGEDEDEDEDEAA